MMDDELLTLVRRNLELSKENNQILRRMRRSAAWGTFFRIVWLAVVIGVPIFVYYYFLVPYYEGFRESYDRFEEQVGDINIPGVGSLLKFFPGDHSTSTSIE
jgi:hypothetical protein